MKPLKVFLQMLSLLLLMAGCSCQTTIEEPKRKPIEDHAQKLDDTRFLTTGPLVSKDVIDVVKTIGEPTHIDWRSCTVPVEVSPKVMLPLVGDLWLYTNQNEEMSAERYLCVVRIYVVSEKMMLISHKNGRTVVSTTEYMDNALAKALWEGEQPPNDKDNIGRVPGFEI